MNMPATSDANAKAAEASARALSEAISALRGLGGYLEKVFGTVPEDLVGYFGGDRLKLARAENLVRIMQRSREINEERIVEPEMVSVSVALPLLIAAADESRNELADIWARLLAAASDPSRSGSFRIAFIDAAKRMDPLDARVLEAIKSAPAALDVRATIEYRAQLPIKIGLTPDQFAVSLMNLEGLKLAFSPNSSIYVLTPFGREFMRALNDRVDEK